MSPPMESVMKDKIGLWFKTIGGRAVKDVRTDTRKISVDVISRHLWGDSGQFKTLESESEFQLLLDAIHPQNVYVPSWLIHFPRISAFFEKVKGVAGENPMNTIRAHAFKSFVKYKQSEGNKLDIGKDTEKVHSMGDKLWTQHVSNGGEFTDDQIAAELSDLFLAGMDTTADTLTYVFWLLSDPQYASIQQTLRAEVQSLQYENDLPSVADVDKLPYLDAVLKETLRLYPINAGSLPRLSPPGKPTVIYDIEIPPRTICEMQALSVNRDPDVFEKPDVFNPQRWMIPRESTKFKEMNRQLWSFSSGPRMCIGQQYVPDCE
jgi:cytochrome P450